MKKILLLAILVISFVSCEDNSPKGKIEKAFREYVKKNFDDPKSLKEITDIEIGTDTLNLHKLREGMREYVNIAYSIDSAYHIMYDKVIGISRSDYLMRKIESNKRNKENFKDALESMMKYSSCILDNKIGLSLVKSKFDSIFVVDTIVVRDIIKCRINKNGELHLEKYSLNRDTIFKNTIISASGSKAEGIYDFYEESNRYLDFSEKICNQIKLGRDALYKMSQIDDLH